MKGIGGDEYLLTYGAGFVTREHVREADKRAGVAIASVRNDTTIAMASEPVIETVFEIRIEDFDGLSVDGEGGDEQDRDEQNSVFFDVQMFSCHSSFLLI